MRDEEIRILERRLEAGDPDLLDELRAMSAGGSDEARSLLRSHLRQRWGGHTFCSELDLPPDLEARSEDSWFTLRPGGSAIAALSTGAPVYCRMDIVCHEEDVRCELMAEVVREGRCEWCGDFLGRLWYCGSCLATIWSRVWVEDPSYVAEEAWNSIQELDLGVDMMDGVCTAADLARIEAEDEAIWTPPDSGAADLDVDSIS